MYVLFSVTQSCSCWFLMNLWYYYREQQEKHIQEPINDNYVTFVNMINLGCLYIHVSLNMRKDAICYLLWYSAIRWSNHIYNWQNVTQVNGMKNAIMQVTYFLNNPMVNLLFYCHIILHWERKWLLMRYLAAILPLKSELSGKFLRFIAFNGSIKMLKYSWIFKNFS